MLDREQQLAVAPAEVEIAVAPGVEIAGAAQRLAVLAARRRVLPQVVDEHDGHVVGALDRTQLAQQRGHFAARVLVDAVQPHERIENEQPGPALVERRAEPVTIPRGVQAHAVGHDEPDVKVGQRQAARPGDRLQPVTDAHRRVLGGVELARTYDDPARVATRLDELADAEAAIAGRLPLVPRVH